MAPKSWEAQQGEGEQAFYGTTSERNLIVLRTGERVAQVIVPILAHLAAVGRKEGKVCLVESVGVCVHVSSMRDGGVKSNSNLSMWTVETYFTFGCPKLLVSNLY